MCAARGGAPSRPDGKSTVPPRAARARETLVSRVSTVIPVCVQTLRRPGEVVCRFKTSGEPTHPPPTLRRPTHLNPSAIAKCRPPPFSVSAPAVAACHAGAALSAPRPRALSRRSRLSHPLRLACWHRSTPGHSQSCSHAALLQHPRVASTDTDRAARAARRHRAPPCGMHQGTRPRASVPRVASLTMPTLATARTLNAMPSSRWT